MSLAHECKFPGEVVGILQSAVHSVPLGRRADVGSVSGEQDPIRPVSRCDFRLAVEPCRVRNIVEGDRR